MMRRRAFAGQHDDQVKARRQEAWAGLTVASDEDAVVKNVVPDSPAFQSGLSFCDVIVAIDGMRVNASSIGKRLADARPGQVVQVTYFRRDQLRKTTLRLTRNSERKWSFTLDSAAPAFSKRVRTGWLRGF